MPVTVQGARDRAMAEWEAAREAAREAGISDVQETSKQSGPFHIRGECGTGIKQEWGAVTGTGPGCGGTALQREKQRQRRPLLGCDILSESGLRREPASPQGRQSLLPRKNLESSGNSKGECVAGAREGRGQSSSRDRASVARTCVLVHSLIPTLPEAFSVMNK